MTRPRISPVRGCVAFLVVVISGVLPSSGALMARNPEYGRIGMARGLLANFLQTILLFTLFKARYTRSGVGFLTRFLALKRLCRSVAGREPRNIRHKIQVVVLVLADPI